MAALNSTLNTESPADIASFRIEQATAIVDSLRAGMTAEGSIIELSQTNIVNTLWAIAEFLGQAQEAIEQLV